MIEILVCKCADCVHWEVVRIEGVTHLDCKTCGAKIPADIKVDEHAHLVHYEVRETE
jgi:hypothetical protein